MGTIRGIPAGCALILFGWSAKPATLQMDVYNLAEEVLLSEVRQVLERIFASSSIHLDWILKNPDSPEGQVIVQAGNLISRQQAACAAKRSISLRIAAYAPPDNDSSELVISVF